MRADTMETSALTVGEHRQGEPTPDREVPTVGKAICSIDSCSTEALAYGWCSKHYQRWKRHGDPEYAQVVRHGGADWERFWSKVEIGDCWQWLGGTNQSGYGRFRFSAGHTKVAHRVSYEWLVGPIADGLELDHLCRNRGCVNPDHLDVTDHRTNVLRGDGIAGRAARREHCRYGHPYTPENLVIKAKGARVCRECNNASSRESKRRRRARG